MVRFGTSPFIDCGSDRRFSAAHARIRARAGRSIEQIYRNVRRFPGHLIGLPRERARHLVEIHRQEVARFYAALWDEYISENPRLLEPLCAAKGVTEDAADPAQPSSAAELWRIRTEVLKLAES
ncbi:MAG TPA: hypothetical protein VF816_01335 [Rhodocyclaceae bacterium]